MKTNFGNAGFTCLLVEFTGGLLVLIRLPLNYARGSSPRNQIVKSLQAAQILRVRAKNRVDESIFPVKLSRTRDGLVDKVEFNRGTVNRETTPWNTR